jgi:hypothetical protein
MKPTIAILVLSALTAAHAQQPEPPNVPFPPKQPSPQVAPVRAAAPPPQEIEKSVNDIVRRSLGVAEEAAANGVRFAQRATAAAATAAQNAEAQLQDLHSSTSLYGGSYGGSGTSRGNRSLVIQSTEPDPVANANAEEDLAIMARILRKAVGSSQDDRRMVMNIPVDGSVFGSASGARNIYLDGYGALFLLTVRYPLIAPTEKPEEPKAKDTTSDAWREAARDEELENSGRPGGYGSASGQAWSWSSTRSPAEDFDAEKVDKLKTSLLESLKNATNIRALKPNDFVIVVVQGAEAVRTEVMKRKPSTTAVGKQSPGPADPDSKAPGAAPSKLVVKSSRNRSSLGETVMTIRVKKSDADAFAQGKMDLEAFRKKAAVQTYFRKTDSTSASNFFAPQAR